MNFFRKREAQSSPLTCEEIVSRYAEILEFDPSGNVSLPYEPELIKASIVARAVELGTPDAMRICREGFVALNTFIGRSRHVPLTEVDEQELLAMVDQECVDLAKEFEKRVALKQELENA